MTSPRTRFAPSPTGFLHLGSARTALYNWAFTRRHGGTFVLRVEDTDKERSTQESEAAVLEGLVWLGLDWDEGPYRQSERADRHAEAVEQLLESGHAYRCTCSKEALEAAREHDLKTGGKGIYPGTCRHLDLGPDCGPHVVRLKVPIDGSLGWDDLVFGPSGQDASEIGDGVIRRSDGSPLYHLAVVVDDVDMQISHVIRGADHHSNTPFQIALYRALGAEPPTFAHVPLIVGEGGRKLSKRRDPVSIQHFRQEGYLAPALVNWLVRLGWSHGDQEIFSMQEIAEVFDLEHVGRGGARADLGKLQWLNQHYIKELPAEALFQAVKPHLEHVAGSPVEPTPGLHALLEPLRERSKTLAEMAQQARWLLVEEIEIDVKAAGKHLKAGIREPLAALIEALRGLDGWSEASLEAAFEAVCAERDLKLGKLAQPVRVAVTGQSFSPGIYETLVALGRERTLRRLEAALQGLPAPVS